MSGLPRKVVQCALDGSDVRSFPSAKEAAKVFGSDCPTSILRSIKYGTRAFGFLWRYAGAPLAKKRDGLTPGKARAIVATKADGTHVATYPSQMEASRQLGIGVSTIESLLMTGGVGKGYHFYYKEEGDRKKCRSRFSKPVVSLNDDDSVHREYPSARDAARELKVNPSAIYACLNPKNPNDRCKGHRFRYKQDLEDK